MKIPKAVKNPVVNKIARKVQQELRIANFCQFL